MATYEGKIAAVLKQGKASPVFYRVVPIYDTMGETVLPIGLQMEAVAVDAADNVIDTIFNFTLWNG